MSGVDLAKVLELHEEATRRREAKMCGVNGCVLVVGHVGDHYTQAHHGAGDCSDVIRYRLAATQRDRYAAVVELVPAMVEELEALRESLQLYRDGKCVAETVVDRVEAALIDALASWFDRKARKADQLGYTGKSQQYADLAEVVRSGAWREAIR